MRTKWIWGIIAAIICACALYIGGLGGQNNDLSGKIIPVSTQLFKTVSTAPLTVVTNENVNDAQTSSALEQEITERTQIYKNSMHQYIGDDSGSLDELLTREYSINELQEYFQECGTYNYHANGQPKEYRLIEDVNEKFPVEVFRVDLYTVYKVKEGGYYYIFWEYFAPNGKPYDESGKLVPHDWRVKIHVYLPSSSNDELLEKIKPGMMIEEVMSISPECTFLDKDSGTLPGLASTMHYLNPDTLMRVEYEGALKSSYGLRAIKIETYRRNAFLGLGLILEKDLPQK